MSKMIKTIKPIKQVKASIRLPGSKSITHRALMMAALGKAESKILNPLRAEDTILTAEALQALGVDLDWNGDTIQVTPPAQRWIQPSSPIFLGNSGTSMRLLLAVAAAGKGTFVFDGTPRLRERPIGPVLQALEGLGVRCRCLREKGYPPVEITSEGLRGGKVMVDASQSSQFLSALLMAAPLAGSEVQIGWREPIASFPYVALTLSMMEDAGLDTKWISSNQVLVSAPQEYSATSYLVEGDCSSASYFWAAAALTGGEVSTSPISPGSSQGDCRLLGVLEEMGCSINWEEDGVRVSGAQSVKPIDIDMNHMPDMVPTIAVLAAFASGRTTIRNVAHLRVKESDRLLAVASELSKFGVPVRELEDGLIIDGGKVERPLEPIETYDDHRIAMAFSLMGLCIEGVTIAGAESVAKSFPSYWDLFEAMGTDS